MADGIAVAGVASMRVNGEAVSVVGNIVLNLGTPIREDLEVATGPIGFKERAGTPSIEFETIKTSSMSLEELATLKGIDITVTLADGTSYAYANAWSRGDNNLETEESKIALAFSALSAKEVAAS